MVWLTALRLPGSLSVSRATPSEMSMFTKAMVRSMARHRRYGAPVPPAAFASFSHRGFRYFWFGGFITNSARWFQYVALPVVVWDLTGSPGWVGLAGFAQFAAMAMVAPAAGVVADHYSRRRILMISQSFMGVVAVVMALAWIQGVRSPAAYVALAAASGVGGGLNLPVWQAFVSELVPRDLLLNAVTLNSTQFNSSRLIGPMLGGITVAAAGPAAAFWVSAAGALVVLFALARVESSIAVAGRGIPSMRLIRNTMAVARYVRARRGLVVAFVTVTLIGSVGLPIQMLCVVFAEDVFDRGPGGFGFMLTMLGVGAVVAAPVVASLGGRVSRSAIQRVALVVYGTAVLALAVAPTFVVYLVPLAAIGAAHLASASALNTAVQLQVDEDRRTQVMSLYVMVLMSSNPLGQLALGQLIELVGARPAFGIYGALLLAGTALLHAAGWLRQLDAEIGEYSPEVLPEVHPTTPSPPRHRGDTT
ncbi:MAG: MFS transporter [Acidimicrobiaceae bacterium]|nr:MFS transporter [Acidimicrobiaceae bacterium]MXZ66182.1 MFS transporter [Acidimicrobiaceae bacterium]MYF32683.1 MFS transporter [Acidimicrobiaceae bacterium]MYG79656.1 MFS transporter [Acidimicrobiaceae bacterium]MYJ29247.1 MFS transporter [Acidimicrobiaceae bacterium]